jgi:hypothetical protein
MVEGGDSRGFRGRYTRQPISTPRPRPGVESPAPQTARRRLNRAPRLSDGSGPTSRAAGGCGWRSSPARPRSGSSRIRVLPRARRPRCRSRRPRSGAQNAPFRIKSVEWAKFTSREGGQAALLEDHSREPQRTVVPGLPSQGHTPELWSPATSTRPSSASLRPSTARSPRSAFRSEATGTGSASS